MSAAGPRILFRNLILGGFGAFLFYLLLPQTSSPAERWSLEFSGFIIVSCLGALLLRCEHSYHDWGCLVGPAAGIGLTVGWAALLDFCHVNPAATVAGAMALIGLLTTTWISLPTLSLVDLLAFALYSAGVGGAAVWIVTLSPGGHGLVQGLAMVFYTDAAMVVLVLGHSVGRRPPAEKPAATSPPSPVGTPLPPAPGPPAPKPPAKLSELPLPAGAAPPPAGDFVRTDGHRAFCCGRKPFPAWLFADGGWHKLMLEGRPHDMEWPKAVATDHRGEVFLLTRSDISYDAHIEESIWCDLWYAFDGSAARELADPPSVSEWWGEST